MVCNLPTSVADRLHDYKSPSISCIHSCGGESRIPEAFISTNHIPSRQTTLQYNALRACLQLTVPHEAWTDIVPFVHWGDNVSMAIRMFDEDALWSYTIGGLCESYPDDEMEVRGVIAWNPPWYVSG